MTRIAISNRHPASSTARAAAALFVAAMLGCLSAQTYAQESTRSSRPNELVNAREATADLEKQFWACDYAATTRGVGLGEGAMCNEVYEDLSVQQRPLKSVQGRNPLGLRFLRRFRLATTVEGDRLANERLEGGLVNFFSFVDVDRAAYVSVETRVEETGRILQRRALGEGQLHDILIGFASADHAVVRPDRGAGCGCFDPLPLLDDVRVCFLDERTHSAEGFPAPVPEFDDSFRDELRCRLPVARARLFHVVIPTFWSSSAHRSRSLQRRLQLLRCVLAEQEDRAPPGARRASSFFASY